MSSGNLNDRKYRSYVSFGATNIFSKSTTGIIPPDDYKGQEIKEDPHAFDVTCAQADKVYTLGVSTSIIDGTNKYAIAELTLSLPEGTSTPEAIIVKVYREDSAEGATPTTSPIAEKAMISGSREVIPFRNAWGLTKVMISCNSVKHVYGDVTGAFYTP